MKSPLTTSLRKQTPISKKVITYVTAEELKFTHMKQFIRKISKKDIAKKLSLTLLFFLISFNGKAQSLSLTLDADNVDLSFLNTNRTLLSGTQNAAGSVYKYSNLATVEGRNIYAKLTIVSAANASIGAGGFDDDTSNASWFQPYISTSVTSAHIDYRLDFFDTATDFPVYLRNFYLNGINLDGNGTGSEKILFPLNEFNTFTRTEPTTLVAGIVGNDIEFKGGTPQLSGTPSFDSTASFYVFYEFSTTSISFKVGSKGGPLTNRPIALSFGTKKTLAGTTFTNTGSSTNSSNRTNLGVTVTVDQPLTPVGSTINFSIQAQNFGTNSVTATNVIVGTKLPTGYTYVSHSAPSGTSYNTTTGIWTAGSLALNAPKTLTIKATVNATSDESNYVTFANISGDQTETLIDNNARNATIELHIPFVNCSNKLFLSQYEATGGTDLYTLNYATNPITIDQVGQGTADNVKFNAIGYNPLDNFIYGINIGSNHLFRIGDNNIEVDLGAIQNLPVDDYISGDIDKNGNFYIKANNGTLGGAKIYKINITTKTASLITLNAQIKTADFAYNLEDELFYGVDQNSNRLCKFNPVTATVTFIGLTNNGNDYGAMYTDGATGAVYGNRNNGNFYIFNKATGAATLISESIATLGNDGAHCPYAAIFFPVELSISKTDNKTHYIAGTTNTYTIVVANAGPSAAINAVVKDLVPSGIPVANMSYSRVYSGGSAIAVSGSSIDDVVNIEPGAFYTYTVDLIIPTNYTGNLINTATVAVSSSNIENDLSNNSATDTDLPCTPPAISTQPAATQTVCINGTPTTLSVTATGTGTLTYKWYSNASNSNTGGTEIPGATAASYSPSTATVGTIYYYATVTGTCNTATSTTSAVTVTALTTITAQPAASQTICHNATPASLSVTATGTGTLIYKWYSNTTNSNTGGTEISGATAAAYIPFTATVGTTYYYVSVTGTCNTVTSNTSAIIVTALTAITVQPLAVKAFCLNATVTPLSVTATGTGTISYQWYTNAANSNTTGNEISGATAATYTPSNAAVGSTYYYVTATGTCNTVTSNTSYVQVNALTAITTQPVASQTRCQYDSAAALTVAATGSGTLTYQWYNNTSNANTGGTPIASAINASYTPPTSAIGTSYYYVIVTGTCGAITSTVAAVTILTVVNISAQPIANQTLCQNATNSALSVTANGISLTYQWFQNTVNSISGATAIESATSTTFTPPTNVVGTMYYHVRVNGDCGTIQTITPSNITTVVINPLISIGTQPIVSQTVQQNAAVTTIYVSAIGTSLAYQWYSNTTNSNSGGTLIEGATATIYTPSSSQIGTKYYYTVVAGSCGTQTSSVSEVTVTEIICHEPAVLDANAGATLDSRLGISSLPRTGDVGSWPTIRKSGWMVLEAKTKGFVINRVQFNASNQPVASDGTTLVITNPVEGMMVFDTTNNCLKVYTTTNGTDFTWYCMETQTCPE